MRTLFEFCRHSGVLPLQVLIQTVQGVYLHYIVTQHSPHGGKLLLQTGNLTGIVGLHLLQLFQQLLCLQLLLGELFDDRVVVDLRLHLTVLQGKALILVLHLLLIEGCQFLHVVVDLLLLLKAQEEPYRPGYQGEDHQRHQWQHIFFHAYIPIYI